MRRSLLLSMAVLALAAVSAGAQDTPWFDLVNCGFCKNLAAQEGLLEHMKWENFVIGTGMISVTTVEPGWEDKYKAAMAGIEDAAKRFQAGERFPLCGMCTAYGMIKATGKVKEEGFSTKAGDIFVMTSTDPDVIAKIQANAQRTIDEYAKMEAAEKAAKMKKQE